MWPPGPRTAFLLVLLSALAGPLAAEACLRLWPGPWLRPLLDLNLGNPERAQASFDLAEGPLDIVILGSSVAAWDIDGERLVQELSELGHPDRQVLNLAVATAPIRDVAAWTPRLLDRGVRAVVLVVSRRGLRPDYSPDGARVHDPRATLALEGPGAVVMDLNQHLVQGAAWASRTVRYRKAWRRTRPPRWDPDFDAQDRTATGAMRRTLIERAGRTEAKITLDGQGPNVAALRWLAQTLADHGVALVAVQAPLHPKVRNEPFDPVASHLLVAHVEPTGGAVVAGVRDLPNAEWRDADFADAMHLGRRGRVRLTRRAAQALAPLLGD